MIYSKETRVDLWGQKDGGACRECDWEQMMMVMMVMPMIGHELLHRLRNQIPSSTHSSVV